jgi:hypothetical protein
MSFVKKLLIYLLCTVCLGTAVPASGHEYSAYAEALNVLGVLRGTEKVMNSTGCARSEILVMIIRLWERTRFP